jgi:hypothetical protein
MPSQIHIDLPRVSFNYYDQYVSHLPYVLNDALEWLTLLSVSCSRDSAKNVGPEVGYTD